jgi:integrase/recombinase XerD
MTKGIIIASNDTVQVYQMLPRGTTDDMVIDMWLHDLSLNTQAAYERDIKAFRAFVQKTLSQVTLLDLQSFSDSLVWLEKSSKVRAMNAVKSLYTFCHRTGYVPVNVGAALRVKKVPSKLAGRILTEEQVFTMFAFEKDDVKRVILRLLYYAGLRVSELCSLTWADIQPNAQAGQVTVVGKGEKDRSVPIPVEPYQEVLALRGNDAPDMPVFTTRTGTAIDRTRVFRIVQEAASRAGIPGKVSPHWLRHAHASHALNHNAPAQLVRDTLGHSSLLVTDKYSHARPNASSSHFLPL